MIKVLFVCLGNICRSPLAEGIFKKMAEESGLTESIYVDSAGTAAYHIGKQPDPRSVAEALKNDVHLRHKARKLEIDDFYIYDWILAMDQANLNDILKIRPANAKANITLVRQWDASNPKGEIPDLYYGGQDGFSLCYDLLYTACKGLMEEIKKAYIYS